MTFKTNYTYEDVGTSSKDGVKVTLSQLDRQEIADKWNAYGEHRNTNDASLKLKRIKKMRLKRLKDTDFYTLSDTESIPSYITTWRQALRDLPQNFTTEIEYDELLARDENQNLTHSIWAQPTS